MIELVIDQRRKDLGGFEVGRGEPVGPRFIEWNFVSSSKDRFRDVVTGRLS